jgi:hypothetical protein
MIYCKIADGVVVERALFEKRMPSSWPDREAWVRSSTAQIGWGYSDGAFVPPPPPEVNTEPQPYRLYKSVFIRRLVKDEEKDEAEIMEGVLAQADAQLRLLFNSVEYFVSDDPLFATLKVAVGAALGDPRADELLAPEL